MEFLILETIYRFEDEIFDLRFFAYSQKIDIMERLYCTSFLQKTLAHGSSLLKEVKSNDKTSKI